MDIGSNRRIIAGVVLAKCRKCGEFKPLDSFGFDRRSQNARLDTCSNCQSGSLEWCRKSGTREALNAKSHIARSGTSDGFTGEEWIKLVAYYSPDGRCLCCGRAGELAMDHVVSLASKGSNTIGNIQPLCKSCNSKKHSKSIDYRTDHGLYAKLIEEEHAKNR